MLRPERLEHEEGGLEAARDGELRGYEHSGNTLEAGRTAFTATAPVYLAKIDEHFSRHLTAREREVVTRALTKVVDAHTDRLPPPTRR